MTTIAGRPAADYLPVLLHLFDTSRRDPGGALHLACELSPADADLLQAGLATMRAELVQEERLPLSTPLHQVDADALVRLVQRVCG